MHQCAIECCKDSSNNIESLEKCNENCSREMMAARNYVQNEFNKWQVCYLHLLNAAVFIFVQLVELTDLILSNLVILYNN